ncbi:hypothetical protein ACVIHC_002216 [Bradyrhizobium diazoefficiens]
MNRNLFNRELGCLPLFTPTNNAGDVAKRAFSALPGIAESVAGLQRFGEASGNRRGEPTETKHQNGIQARVIAYLKEHGGIDALTVQKLGTTDARKIFSRLRDKGYLFAADDPQGHEDRPNASGQGCYRWHRWTGKQ